MLDFFKNHRYSVDNILIHMLRNTSCLWSDEAYCRLMYRLKMGAWPNLTHPVLYQEKLNWLKLYYHDNRLTKLVDKYEVKKIVSELIGEKYVVKNLGVWDSFDDIDFANLPNSFVLKCTHDSASYVIVHNKSKMNMDEARLRIQSHLKKNYFKLYREWPYKNCKPRVMAEELLPTDDNNGLTDYKFFCFNGVPRFLYVSHDASNDVHTDFFNMQYDLLNMRMKDPNSLQPPIKPLQFEEMKSLAKQLCKGFPHVRVDFYICGDKVYFGEFTFFHNAGFERIHPEHWNVKLGEWIDLPEKRK